MKITTTVYDYANQAWTENGKYVRCGHPASMNCQCYGRLHQGEPINHTKDSDCDVDVYGSCVLCGVLHGDPCPTCGGKGFHAEDCPDSDGNYMPQDHHGASLMLFNAANYLHANQLGDPGRVKAMDLLDSLRHSMAGAQ